MKKLLLLIGLIVFLTPMVVSGNDNTTFCYKWPGLFPHNPSNSSCSNPIDAKYVINKKWITNKYCKKLKIKNECVCIKSNQIKLFNEGKIDEICEKKKIVVKSNKQTKIKLNQSISKSLSKIDDKTFCLKSTFIDFKNGNTFWKDDIKLDIKSDIKYSATEVIEEANKRKLNLLDCIYISDSFRLLDKKNVKLRIFNKDNQKFEVVEDHIIKNLKEKFNKREKDYKYKVPNGYVAKLNLIKERECNKNNGKLFHGSQLRENKKEVFIKACIYKNKISIISIRLENFKEIEIFSRDFAPPDNKSWKINKNNKFEIKAKKLISNNIYATPDLISFSFNLIGEVSEEIILISNLKLSGHEEFKELKDFYNEFSIELGCGSKNKDVKDCIRRYLPSIIGSGPMDLQQINKISEDKELMSEIVFAIRELNRAQNQSNESSEEERQAQEGQEMYVQEEGRWVWVDTRTGYQKYIDKWGTVALNPYQRAYVTGLKIRGNLLGINSLNTNEIKLLNRVTSNGLLRLPQKKINTPTSKGYFTKN